jgi:hypothetical protein
MANFGSALAGSFEGVAQQQKDARTAALEQVDLMTKQENLRVSQAKENLEMQQQIRRQKAENNAAAYLSAFGQQGSPPPGAPGPQSGNAPPPPQQGPPQGQPPGPPQGQPQQMLQAMPQQGPMPGQAPPQPPPQQSTMTNGMPPPPMRPGQPSQPMQQTGQRPPMPPQGQPQPGQAPLPPGPPPGGGGMQPQGQPPIPPYQRIGAQQPQPGQPMPDGSGAHAPEHQLPVVPIPDEPPAKKSMDLQSILSWAQQKGIHGTDLPDFLDQMKPYMDAQAKTQADALKQKIDIMKTQIDAQKAEETGRHNTAEEGLGQGRINAELSNAAGRRDQAAATRAASAQAHDDAGWQAGVDKDGNPVRMNVRTGQTAPFSGSSLPAGKMSSTPGGAGGGKLSKEAADEMAGQYLAGDKTVFTNLGRGAQGAQNVVAVRERVAQMAKEQGLDPAAVVKGFNTQVANTSEARAVGARSATLGMAGEATRRVGQIALDASDKVPRSQFVPVNKALQAWKTNTGDPAIVAFGAANNTLINAYSRAVSPTGVSTVSDKEHARDMLSTAQTPEQYKAVVAQMYKEVDAEKAAVQDVKDQVGGKKTSSGSGVVNFADLK